MEIRIAIIGLGYVGLPLAHLFSSKFATIGYDENEQRVREVSAAFDRKRQLTAEQLQTAINEGLRFTSSLADIADCNFYIVSVPTPVDVNNKIDIQMLLRASRAVGSVLSKGDFVVFESTVYPGMTEEECVPAIEEVSGLRYNEDFFVGYSPERVNPCDEQHTIANTVKIVSASNESAAQFVNDVYSSVVAAGTYLAPSIRVAEAAKIVENAQRDVNIGFINEMAKIFNAMGLDTHDVLRAASTKWNFVPVEPGLVGGHCIAVDPYYLIEKAQVYGVMPHVVSSARKLNDSMGVYVANELIKLMSINGLAIKDARILLLGITFKEDCPDVRGSKVVDIYSTLRPYTSQISVYDQLADADEVRNAFGIKLLDAPINKFQNYFDAVVICVAHSEFATLDVRNLLRSGGVVYDVKGRMPRHLVDKRL